MQRFFNTAGPVNPQEHYCLDPAMRIDFAGIFGLIKQKKYFILHAPRQTGKTSALLAIRDRLNAGGEFSCVYLNVEAAQAVRGNVAAGMKIISATLADQAAATIGNDTAKNELLSMYQTFGEEGSFGAALTRLAETSARPLLVLIDEIDSLIGDTLISVLRQIRAGYDRRPARFPQSIILCGVRDIRDYRIKQEGAQIITGGSAFNIKAESIRLGDFSRNDVITLLSQHTAETGQVFEPEALERVWYLTQGQPWLVNALAYETCFRMKENLDRSRRITAEMIDAAKEAIIERRETHIDQLSDKLQEPRVRRVIEPLLRGELSLGNIPTDDLLYVEDLGLIRSRPQTEISNPIYKEVIPRELTFTTQSGIAYQTSWYIDAQGKLLVGKLLEAFQQFFRENSEIWLERFDYKEAGPQLLMQAFLQRIINGGGAIEREYGLGRGRTDLYVQWPLPDGTKQRFVIELKILRKSLERTLAEGVAQTLEYAERCGATEAHLIIFDRTPGKSWEEKIWRRREQLNERWVEVWGM